MFDNLRDTLDFDDLLFENRNKHYGAYQLRKRYNGVVVAGILMATILAASVVILPFVISPREDKPISGAISFVQVNMENLQPPVDEIIVPPPPAPRGVEHIEEIVKYVPPEVVDTVNPLEKEPVTTDEVLAQPAVEEKFTAGGTGNGDDIITGQDGVTTDNAFYIVEVMPTFKGGDLNKFREWVMKRTNYPQAAIDNKIQGKVFITFIVETDGTVSNVNIVKGVNPLIDNEAVRTIQSSPKWTPGFQRGKAVRVRFAMPLSFTL